MKSIKLFITASLLVSLTGYGQPSLVNSDQLTSGLATKENSLGNPDTNGKVLSSTTGGTRSWITPASGGTWGSITGTLSDQNDVYTSIKTKRSGSDYLPWTTKYILNLRTSNKQMILHTFSEGDSWLAPVRIEDGLDSQFGWFGETYQAGQLSLSGGATLATQHTKYSIGSPSGQTVLLTGSGHTATMERAGGRLFPSHKLFIGYRRQSGGGTFQPQVYDTTNNWVNAGSTVSTSGSEGIIWYEYSYEALMGYTSYGSKIRAVWSSGGTVEIVAIGVTNVAGNEPDTLNRNGVIGYNASSNGSTVAMWDTIPQSSWNSTMTYLKTNIVFLRDYRETNLYSNDPTIWLTTLQSVMTKMQTGRKSSFTASLVFAAEDATKTITLTAVNSGIAGESIQVKFLKSGNGTTLTTVVSGNNITVNLATDGSGNVTSTAAQVVTSINGAASSLVTASGSGSGTCNNTVGFIPLSCGVGIDFVLIGTHPTGPQYESENIRSDNAMRQFCEDNRILFIDSRSYFPVNFADSMKQGFQQTDELHLTNDGSKFLSNLIVRKLDLNNIMNFYQYGIKDIVPSYTAGGAYNKYFKVGYDSASGDSSLAFLGFSKTNGGTVSQSDGWGMVPATRASQWLSDGVKETMAGTTFRQIVQDGSRQTIGYATEVSRLIGGSLEIGTESVSKIPLTISGMTGQTSNILEVRTGASSSALGTLVSGFDKQGVIFSNIPTKANDAAADSDSSIPSGGFYKITGSRAVYVKP